MSTKKKIILTVLLGVLVGVMIFGVVALFMQIDNAKINATSEALYRSEIQRKYCLGQYYDLIYKIIIRIIATCLSLLFILGIWLNWFIPKNLIKDYEKEKEQKIIEKKEAKKKKLQDKINNL